jgi:hypothetical protein
MSSQQQQQPGFFPNILSVLVFSVIMVGIFFGFTRLYPQLVQQWQAAQPLQTITSIPVAEQIAPFVRGTLSGVTAASVSSTRDNKALNISEVKGYQHGVKTALLASNNWYDLDRQLFRSHGIALGVSLAVDTSKPVLERATLAYQIKLIQRIQLALAVDLEGLLTSNEDHRRETLQDYSDGLRKLSAEAGVELANMQRIIDEAQGEVDANTSLSQQFSDSFSTETSEFVTENIDRNLDQFVEARKKLEVARVTVSSTNQIVKQLQPLAARLNTVIPAIEANFEALAAGIKVAPVKGVNLPILQSQ